MFTELLSRPGARIERIVSNGQSTPEDTPFNQNHDEWVLLLCGSASLWVDGDGDHDLHPGDHMLIPARRIHRVTRTAERRTDRLARRALLLSQYVRQSRSHANAANGLLTHAT